MSIEKPKKEQTTIDFKKIEKDNKRLIKEAVERVNKEYPDAKVPEYKVSINKEGRFMVEGKSLEEHAKYLDSAFKTDPNEKWWDK